MMKFLLLFLSFLVLTSCSEKEYSEDLRLESPQFLAAGIGNNLGFTSNYDGKGRYTNISYNQSPTPESQSQKIIKTSWLRYETQDLEQTREQVLAVIQQYDGYIQNDNSGRDRNQLFHRLAVRVPTASFQQFLDEVAKDVNYFDERTVNQKDVTEEFIDLEARLKAKRKLEDRYLELLAKAKDVKEMLDIERELAKIREEIEAKQGRLQYLENQVSWSTVNIHFYKVTSETGVTQSYGSKIKNAFKNGWSSISSFFLSVLGIWPFIILIIITFLFIRRWIKRRKKK